MKTPSVIFGRKTPPAIPNRFFKKRSLALALCSIAVLPLCAAQTPSETPGAKYDLGNRSYTSPSLIGIKPVNLLFVESGRVKEYPVTVTTEGLEVKIAAMGGSIFYPWEGLNDILINTPTTPIITKAMSAQDPHTQILALKEFATALAPLASIPEESTNIHKFVERYMDALLQTGDVDTAFALSQRFAINRIPAGLAKKLYVLTESLLIEGKDTPALTLIQQLYAARPVEEFQESSQSLAQNLLKKRYFGPAFGLYVPLFENADPAAAPALALRCAYLALELELFDAYQHYRSLGGDDAASDDATLSAHYLLEGVWAAKQGDPLATQNSVGHALALLLSDSNWKEIALYYNYQAYRRTDAPDVAQMVLHEMELLFPDSAYTHAISTSNTESHSL